MSGFNVTTVFLSKEEIQGISVSVTSVVSHAKDDVGYDSYTHHSLPMKDFIRHINTHMIVQVQMKTNRRNAISDPENLERVHNFLKIDCDKPGESDIVEFCLNEKGLFYIKKPSTNYDDESNRHKWHFVIPLLETFSLKERVFKRQIQILFEHIMGMDIGKIKKSKLFDLSSLTVTTPLNAFKNGNDLKGAIAYSKVKGNNFMHIPNQVAVERIIMDETLEQIASKKVHKRQDISSKKVRQAVKIITSATDYHQWMKIGTMIKGTEVADWYQIFDEYSRRCPGYNPSKNESIIRGFHTELSPNICMGWLINEANNRH
jgi:hypothetical protein